MLHVGGPHIQICYFQTFPLYRLFSDIIIVLPCLFSLDMFRILVATINDLSVLLSSSQGHALDLGCPPNVWYSLAELP